MALTAHTIAVFDRSATLSALISSAIDSEQWKVRTLSAPTQLEDDLTTTLILCTVEGLSTEDQELFISFHNHNPTIPIIALATQQEWRSVDSAFASAITQVLPLVQERTLFQEIVTLTLHHLAPISPTKNTQRAPATGIVAKSKQMLEVLALVTRIAQYSTTVLIRGESGTGKELIAKAIHDQSPRRSKPFVAVNCGAIPETLIESELFGHKRGSFTDATHDKKGLFEEAHGGTLFLDEIGELPMHLQVKLLRALQEKSILSVGAERPTAVDVRVIAASLKDLEQATLNGEFREDLLYRLNVISIELPPLRDRTEDIPALAAHFIRKHNKRLGLAIRGMSDAVTECLCNHYWKGNIRELENVVERGMVLSEKDTIELEALTEAVRISGGKAIQKQNITISGEDLSIKNHARNLEIYLIQKALEQTKGNRTKAAKVLEISHRALLYKLKEYSLS